MGAFTDVDSWIVVLVTLAVIPLTGLVMITWSASFTFLEMQRDWPADMRARERSG